MRLLLAAAVLVAFALPIANAHIVLCAPDDEGVCQVTTLAGGPDREPHASVFVAPCLCAHAEASLAMERFLP